MFDFANITSYWLLSDNGKSINNDLAYCLIAITNITWHKHYKHIRNEDLAECAKAKALYYLLRNVGKWDPHKGNLLGYLILITRTHMSNEISTYLARYGGHYKEAKHCNLFNSMGELIPLAYWDTAFDEIQYTSEASEAKAKADWGNINADGKHDDKAYAKWYYINITKPARLLKTQKHQLQIKKAK